MPEYKISAESEEAFRRLHELFGRADPSAPKRGCRRYVLEFQTGKPVLSEAFTDAAVDGVVRRRKSGMLKSSGVSYCCFSTGAFVPTFLIVFFSFGVTLPPVR